MTKLAHRRHDITDKMWERLEPHLPGQRGQWGGIAKDNRQFETFALSQQTVPNP